MNLNLFFVENTFEILSVGRFMSTKNNHSKNQLLMVKAFEKLYKKDSRFTLTLAGALDSSQNSYFEKENDLVLFPNPATDEITLKSNVNFIGAIISVSSLLGQELEKFTLNSEEKTLNISNYQSGIYILKVNSQDGIKSYKFIKK
jgi:glycosyltransferase involved in cell wall biosynthesis